MILCGFAAIVGVLTTRRIQADFNRQVADAADRAGEQRSTSSVVRDDERPARALQAASSPNLDDLRGAQNAAIRRRHLDGDRAQGESPNAPYFGAAAAAADAEFDGWRVESRPIAAITLVGHRVYVAVRARGSRDVEATANRVKLFLGLGVLGGAALALLAGLATARRAMAPIAELTAAAREIARTRDPSLRIPHPEAEDEVAELARTLEAMLARARRGARRRRRRRSRASASSSPTPRTSCARR